MSLEEYATVRLFSSQRPSSMTEIERCSHLALTFLVNEKSFPILVKSQWAFFVKPNNAPTQQKLTRRRNMLPGFFRVSAPYMLES